MITLCVPSRGRPEKFAEMLDSATRTATQRVECVLVLDKDDSTAKDYPRGGRYLKKIRVDRPQNMSGLWDLAAKTATGDIVMLCADDVIFETEGWDERVEQEFAAVPDEVLMVYTDSGADKRPILPFVSKHWVDTTMVFTPEDYQGWMADEFIWAIAVELGRVVFLDDVMIRHHQFEEIDETYATANTRRLMQGGLEGMRRRFYSAGEVERRDRLVEKLRHEMDESLELPLPDAQWVRFTLEWNKQSRVPERNPGVLVTVHCYQGDADNVRAWLPLYLHHGRPVCVLSPDDSPVVIEHPQVFNHSVGPRAYVGQKSMDRQRKHLEFLVTQPYDWFLMNDADSVCLSADLPEFLFERDDVLWSLHAGDWRKHESPYPKIGLHPPYFCHKKVLQKLLTAADLPQVRAHDKTPFIDWYMLALACESGVEIPDYPAPLGYTWPAWRYNRESLPDNIEMPDDHVRVYEQDGEVAGDDMMAARVAAGAVFLHSIKHPFVMNRLAKIARDRARALGQLKQVSILVPFTEDESGNRTRTWEWVAARWRATVPDAEVVVGVDPGTPPGPYSKTAAVNDAYTRANGDVFVIADADAWMEPEALHRAVDVARRTNKLVVPWKFILRISEEQTEQVLASNPSTVFVTSENMRATAFNGPDPLSAGTMIVISREAFEAVEGMDPRFRGWGMEDVAFGRACQTILGPTVYGNEEVVSLYHPRPVRSTGTAATMRAWDGDTDIEDLDHHPNIALAKLYDGAVNDREAMLRVVREHRLRKSTPGGSNREELQRVIDQQNLVVLPSVVFDEPWVQQGETLSVPVDPAYEESWTMEIAEI